MSTININKYLKRVLLIVSVIFSYTGLGYSQGPAIPGGSGGAPQIGVPLDNTDAIYFLVGAGILYLLYHYRHLLLKKEEALNE